MRLVLLDPPGAGKGTQALKLSQPSHNSRPAICCALPASKGTAVGRQAAEIMARGEILPDELLVGLIPERIEQPNTARGFTLDGFPRTVAQAERLDEARAEPRARAQGRRAAFAGSTPGTRHAGPLAALVGAIK